MNATAAQLAVSRSALLGSSRVDVDMINLLNRATGYNRRTSVLPNTHRVTLWELFRLYLEVDVQAARQDGHPGSTESPSVAEFDIGDRFRPRERRLDIPALADKMVRRSISRGEIDAVLTNNEVIEVYEHDDRVRYVLLGHVARRPLHLVVGQDDIIGATVVISVYEPDEAHGWDPESGFRDRKEDANER